MRELGIRFAVARSIGQVLNLFWPILFLLPRRRRLTNATYTIGVTTFKDRFSTTFRRELRRLVWLFPDTKIIVVANGHVDAEDQKLYLQRIARLCEEFHNVELLTFLEPTGLSKIWNLIVRTSDSESVLMLNDDLDITPLFRRSLESIGLFDSGIALINGVWSHFLIKKEVIKKNGWFDEEFVEIGCEDDDYMYRLAISGLSLDYYDCYQVQNKGKPLKRNSYGHDMTGEFRYSKRNTEVMHRKWVVSESQIPGGTWVERARVFVAKREKE